MSSPKTNPRTAIVILLLMILTPLSAADLTQYSGPPALASSGTGVTVDGWQVPGNATILNGWLNVDEDAMPSNGNGSFWDNTTANSNFSSGTFDNSTWTHFDSNQLSLATNGSFGNVDSFNRAPSFQLAASFTGGGSGVTWTPTDLNYSGTPAGNGGNTVANGTIPANPTEGSLAVGTNPNGGVPAGSDAWLTATPIQLPSPITNFTFEFDHWYHIHTPNNINGDMDGVWVEYRLDNGSWTWMAPRAGYNNTISPSATVPAGANQSANGTHGFPVWAKTGYSGWEHSVFDLDNLTGINNASSINFRLRIWTHQNSTVRPGVFVDNITLQNIGSGVGYWHHGCYVSTGTCGYSNNAIGALQLNQPLNLSGITGSPILRTHLEWDLEGSGWDNFCVEMSSNNNTWVDISSSTNSTATACRSRTGAIPGSGYTIGNTTYGDETNALVDLDLAIPSQFLNTSTVYLRYRVDTDSSVTQGGSIDNQEGLTIDRIQVRDSAANNSAVHFDDHFTGSGTAFHYGIGTTIEDWGYVIIGAGGLHEAYGFEDSPAFPPGGWTVSSTGSGDVWEYGLVSNANGYGPSAWPSGNYGFGIDLDDGYDGSEETHLFTPSYSIPQGASARLTFDHWRCAEDGWDGGAVFVSVNNGNWTYFNPSLPNGSSWYDGALSFGSHILSGLDVFDGRSYIGAGGFSCQGATIPWVTETADLSQYTGSNLKFRFTFASDSIVNIDGWYLDEIGVEVDYFETTGDWLSPAITLEEPGLGFVDIDAMTTNDTWVSGSITDTGGIPLAGYDNLTFPISLAGIDRDVYPAIKIRVNLGTTNPFVSPLVTHLHYGSTRIFEAGQSSNGWTVDPALQLVNGNWTNPSPAPKTIISDFVPSTAPIQHVNFSGIGTGVTTQISDSRGNLHGSGGLSSMLSFPSREPGFGVRYTIAPNGVLSSATAVGDLLQPALNPTIDVTDDGTVDWQFPSAPYYSHFGWQTYIASQDSNPAVANSTSHSANANWAGSGVEVLVPDNSTVTSGLIAFIPSTTTDGSLQLLVEGSTARTWNAGLSGIVYATLPNSALSDINSEVASSTDPTTGRLWKDIDFDWSIVNSTTLSVQSITLGYELSENVTGLGQQMYDFHASQLQGSVPVSIDIPLTYRADAGAVGLDGGIYHEMMITNLPFSAPVTMYPDGQIYEIVTRHHHLNDNSEIGSISLTGSGSDGENVNFTVTDLANGGSFSSSANYLNLDSSSNVVESGGDWVVTWRFTVSWLWDDVTQIDWMAKAVDLGGEGLSPAFAISGGPGKNAIENDLQIDSFEVRDQFDRLITIDPNRDFFAMTTSELRISGTVRFQDNVANRPLTNDYSVGINYTGVDYAMTSIDNGSFEGVLTMPESATLNTLIPRIVRVGPASGAFGGEDETGPMDTVEVIGDSQQPNSDVLQVLTSHGLLDANGYVWEPAQPLSVRVTVSDPEALGEDLTLNYWREGVDDIDDDGEADENEYQSMTRPISMPGMSTNQQIEFSNIDVSQVPTNGIASLYLSGTDWAGLPMLNAGTAGSSNDKATMVIASDMPTTLIETTLVMDSISEYLLAGQVHTLSMHVDDANGIGTLDDITIFLAGQPSAPVGEIHIDPREMTVTSPDNSHVTPVGVSSEQVSDTTSKITLSFIVDWTLPSSFGDNWLLPAINIIDDTQTVAAVNNIGDLRWKIDNKLTAEVGMLHDLSEPLCDSNESKLYLRKGDIFAIAGTVRYQGSGADLQKVPEGMQLQAMMSANSITTDVTIDLSGADFNVTMEVPIGYPSTNALPVTIDLLGVPANGQAIPNTELSLTIDSTPPVPEFPAGTLTSIQTDQLEDVLVRVNVLESGGMSTDGLTIKWVYLRNGLNLPGSGGSAILEFEMNAGEIWTFSNEVDFTPAGELEFQQGDQIAVWLEGADLAGNELFGEGTIDSPRSPQVLIRIFQPEVIRFEINPLEPDIGESVFIQATIQNNGTTVGSLNVTLVEELDDGTMQVYDSMNITGLAPLQRKVVSFSWEAWDSGSPALYLMFDGDENRLTALNPQITVKSEEDSGGLFGEGGGSSVMLILGLLAILIFGGIIALAAVFMRQRDDWEDEDEWDRAEAIATAAIEAPVTAPVAPQSEQVSVPADAPLPEQTPSADSDAAWLERAKLTFPDWPDESLLGYKANGWTIEQLQEWQLQQDEQ